MQAVSVEAGAPRGVRAPRGRFGNLMLGSIGVVFGDIGTSPILHLQGGGSGGQRSDGRWRATRPIPARSSPFRPGVWSKWGMQMAL